MCSVSLDPAAASAVGKAGWLAIRRKWGKTLACVILRDGSSGVCMTADGTAQALDNGWNAVLDLAGGNATTPETAVLVAATADLAAAATSRGADPSRLPSARQLRAWAAAELGASIAKQRAALPALVAAGSSGELSILSLSPSEVRTAQADRAAALGDWSAAASHYAALPPNRYASRLPAAIRCLTRGDPEGPLKQSLLGWVGSFPGEPLAQLAVEYFSGTPVSVGRAAEVLRGFGGQRADVASEALTELARGQIPRGLDGVLPEIPLLRRIAGEPADVEWGRLRPQAVDEAHLDDLIDAGQVSQADVAGLERRPDLDLIYVTARLNPAALSAAAVADLGWTSELDRRAAQTGSRSGQAAEGAVLASRYLAGDDSVIESLRDRWPEAELAALRRDRAIVRSKVPSLPTDAELLFGKFTRPAVLAHAWEQLPEIEDGEPEQRRLAAALGLRKARQALWDAQWERAREWSREVLRLATDEDSRDEALNILACALWQEGDAAGALAALQQALAGEYTLNLAVNAALVAAELDPVAAAEHLGKIIREAPQADMKVAAAKIAVGSWMAHQDQFAELTDDDGHLPPVLADPLRRLARDPIELDDFRIIIELLARFDDDWLTTPGALRGCRWEGSVEATYYLASAAGPVDTAKALCTLTAAHPELDWLSAERERFIDLLFRYLLTVDDVPIVGIAAFELLDGHLPMSEDIKLPLAAMAARELSFYVRRNGEDPSSRLAEHRVELIAWAAKNVRTISEPRRDDAVAIIQSCADAVQYGIIAGLQSEITRTLEGARRPTNNAQLRAYNQALKQCTTDWSAELLRLRPYCSQEGVDATDDFLKAIYSLL